MGLFRQQNQGTSQRDILLGKYNAARNDVLLICIFTIVNIIFLATGGDIYMLFAANIPYAIVDFGMLFCGLYPDELYTDEFADLAFLDESAFAIFIIVAIAITGMYLLAYLRSKKQNTGWLVFSLVLISTDTAFMLFYYEPSLMMLPDLIFHGLMIYGIVRGISAVKKLSELPPEEAQVQEGDPNESADTRRTDLVDSTPLRAADLSAKHRILLEDTVYGHKVIYRRVKKTNELIIDNYVYAEYIAWAEMAHMLTANLDGHAFAVGFDSVGAKSYLMVDGRTVKEKIRLI